MEWMVLIDRSGGDFLTGAKPNKDLGKFCNIMTVHTARGGYAGEGSSKFQKSLSMSMPGTPPTPGTPVTPTNMSPTARKENVWRSVFHPGSNIATKRIGAEVFDKPSHPNSPTVYDWPLYSGETRSKHQ